MKKTILTAVVIGAAASSVMAQGIITFTASGTTRPIQFTLSGASGDTKVPVGAPAQVSTFGSMDVAFFDAPNGTVLGLDANGVPDFTAWTQLTPIVTAISFTAGSVSGTQVIPSPATATTVEFEVVAWTGASTTWTQAEAAALAGTGLIGFSGSTLSGGALGWSQGVGTSTAAVNVVTGTTGFNGLVLAPVPEPSTLALGGLAAAALLAFRRKK